MCEDCQERRDAKHERWRAEQAQRSAEYEDSLRARFRAGETVDQVYAAYAARWETNGPCR